MDISFCKGCENMLYIHVDSETNELYNACKACGNIEKMKDMSHHIYSTNTQNKIDKSEIINLNPYISHDITLPIIKNNKNIKCKNELCDNKETVIKYIKYDNTNMKFIYICNHCGSKWLNNI